MSSWTRLRPTLGYLRREYPKTQDRNEDCFTVPGREDVYEVTSAALALELLNQTHLLGGPEALTRSLNPLVAVP